MPSFVTALQLSIRLLTHERRRLFACVGGVSVALILMLLQVGFRSALLDSALELLRQLDADVIVINKEKHPFLSRDSMPMERLYQSLSVPGVVEAAPVWIALQRWKNHESNTLHPIRVIGFDPERPTFLMKDLPEQLELLRTPNTAIVDGASRSSYGDLNPDPAQIGRLQIEIVGQTRLGTDFEVDGTMLVSEATFNNINGYRKNLVEMALLKLEPGSDPDRVAEALSRTLPTDVRAFSKQKLIERDLEFWETGTPISLFLLVGVSLGLFVGIIICYQVLYTEVLDHLPEFATLKAMGYGNRFLEIVVLTEAFMLSALAVIPAVLIAAAILSFLGGLSGLSTGLGLGDIVLISLISFAMCGASAVLALGKVRRLEPAELI